MKLSAIYVCVDVVRLYLQYIQNQQRAIKRRVYCILYSEEEAYRFLLFGYPFDSAHRMRTITQTLLYVFVYLRAWKSSAAAAVFNRKQFMFCVLRNHLAFSFSMAHQLFRCINVFS